MIDNDPNLASRLKLIGDLHKSPTELVLAVSGGGSLAISDLLSVPGGSKTVLEAVVPYTQESLARYIDHVPEQYCCERTARHLAMTSFYRGLWNIRKRREKALDNPIRFLEHVSADVSHDRDYETSMFPALGQNQEPEIDLDDFVHLIGVGCTASLVTDREKKGEYRLHVATQTLRRTTVCSLKLVKGARNRWEEERLVADLILNMIENSRAPFVESDLTLPTQPSPGLGPLSSDMICPMFGSGTTDRFSIKEILPLFLKEGETVSARRTVAMPPLIDLFFGRTWSVLWRDENIQYFKFRKELPTARPLPFNPQAEFTQAVMPGSFNPIHQGHLEMLDIAEKRLGNRVSLEISVTNVDKPTLDYINLQDRLNEIERLRPGQAVWLTQTPRFEDKAHLFPGAMFVVGADTLRRFADLKYYNQSTHQLHDVLRMIAFFNCRFLVFSRQRGEKLESLRTLDIPDMLRSLSDEVPSSDFAMNVSSSELRRQER